jgi:LacI family transcriptional regulator
VARLAGVSRTTVSYVINHRSGGNVRISEETRRKVWEAVEALGYRPSSAAQTLRTNRSNLLAVMIPRVENTFYPQFATAVQYEAEKEGFDVIIYSTHNDPQRERDFLNVLLRRGVDGLVTQSFYLTTDDLDRLVKAGIAVVTHGNSPTHPYADNIVLDETRAAQEMVSYLIQRGHRRVGLISGPEATWTGRLRKQGYLNALQGHAIRPDPDLIRETRYRRGYATRAMQELLALPEPPSAVFGGNDLLAIDAMLSAIDAGLSVPDDVAVVGFDDIPEAVLVRPKLTTVHKDVHVLGATAVEMLVERINHEEPLPARVKTLDYRIVYRESA